MDYCFIGFVSISQRCQRRWAVRLAMGWLVCFASQSLAEDNVRGIGIRPLEVWRAVFADSRVPFQFAITSDQPLSGTLGWALTVNRRTVSSGDISIDGAPGKPALATVPIDLPHVAKGVVLESRLEIAMVGDDGRSRAGFEETIWIFSRDPFFGRTQWLKGLGITLFDPTGTTLGVFNGFEIPVRTARTLSSLQETDAGIIVIGEGVSLVEYPDLGPSMLELASSGTPVLCLAPTDGVIPIPSGDAQSDTRPVGVAFRRNDIIRELDKRLEPDLWLGGGSVKRSFRLVPNDDNVGAEMAPPRQGWSWIEIKYPHDRGRLILCGFGLVQQWEDGPVPRYLFAELLERLSAHEESQSKTPK